MCTVLHASLMPLIDPDSKYVTTSLLKRNRAICCTQTLRKRRLKGSNQCLSNSCKVVVINLTKWARKKRGRGVAMCASPPFYIFLFEVRSSSSLDMERVLSTLKNPHFSKLLKNVISDLNQPLSKWWRMASPKVEAGRANKKKV